jgi:hypothetical protein
MKLDAWIILKHDKTGRYHPAFFTEDKIEGVTSSFLEPGIVRLNSKFHHAEGFDNLSDAIKIMRHSASQQMIHPNSICDIPVEWDGEFGIHIVLKDWRAYDSICDSLHKNQ